MEDRLLEIILIGIEECIYLFLFYPYMGPSHHYEDAHSATMRMLLFEMKLYSEKILKM